MQNNHTNKHILTIATLSNYSHPTKWSDTKWSFPV